MGTIIVVDDYAVLRSLVIEYLNAASSLFKVIGEAQNGLEALQLTEAVRPNLVLMDVKMPVMDGIITTKIIKERWPETVVITYSGEQDERISAMAIEAGADLHLVKPLDFQDLVVIMEQFLSPILGA
jgi:DNA-binding NarL/FixJ family response regulator